MGSFTAGAGTSYLLSSTAPVPSGTANGVLFLNASKVMTSGSGLTFDGTSFGVGKTGATPLDMVGTFRWNSNVAGTDIWQRFTGGAGLIYDGTTTATDLAWIRNGAEQMRLTGTGLGIGTNNPQYRLDVAGNAQFGVNGFLKVLDTGSGNGRLQITNIGSIDFGGDFYFRNNAGSVINLTLTQQQNVVLGAGAIATNATNGFFYVAGCAGAPTGVPTAFTGRVPIVVDTTNNKLYFYSGGAWRDAGP